MSATKKLPAILAPAWQSVTERHKSYSPVGPLPEALLAALKLAIEMAQCAGSIVTLAACFNPKQHDKNILSIIERNVDEMRREGAYKHVLQVVANELILASEPSQRFGKECAHQAAYAFRTDVLVTVWDAADPSQWARCHKDPSARMDIKAIGKNFGAVCKALSWRTWPNASEIMAACKVEAVKAAAARIGSQEKGSKPRKGNRGRPPLTDEERKKMAKEYADWTASGLPQRDYIQKRGFPGMDTEESLAYLDACRHHWKKSSCGNK